MNLFWGKPIEVNSVVYGTAVMDMRSGIVASSMKCVSSVIGTMSVVMVSTAMYRSVCFVIGGSSVMGASSGRSVGLVLKCTPARGGGGAPQLYVLNCSGCVFPLRP